jgi:hypothetical protein
MRSGYMLASVPNCKTSEITFRALLTGEASDVQLALDWVGTCPRFIADSSPSGLLEAR